MTEAKETDSSELIKPGDIIRVEGVEWMIYELTETDALLSGFDAYSGKLVKTKVKISQLLKYKHELNGLLGSANEIIN